jgi:hypothetical protein
MRTTSHHTPHSQTPVAYRFGWAVRLSALLSGIVLLSALSGALEPTAWAAEFPVTTTADGGPGSLRDAITLANALPGTDTITFNIPPGGVQTITPLSPLPTITDSVIIDGTTQPGFSGSPIIELNGVSAGGGYGLIFEYRGSGSSGTVRGLVVNRFGFVGIEILGGEDHVIEGNYIGTDVTGTAALGNGYGIDISGTFNARIGGTATGARNVIAGNGGFGISISTNGSPEGSNVIEGNYINTDVTGTVALSPSDYGVIINGVSNNRIGGTATGAGNVILGDRSIAIVDNTKYNHESYAACAPMIDSTRPVRWL